MRIKKANLAALYTSMNPFRTLAFLLFLFSVNFASAQSPALITKGEFFRKGVLGLEKTDNYLSGDSAFLLQLTLFQPDTFHRLAVAWYLDGFEGSMPQRIDTSLFGLRNVEGEFSVSFTRSSFAFPVGFYYVKVYLDDVFQETYFFKVLPEPVLSGQFIRVEAQSLLPVNRWNSKDKEVLLRVFLDREEVPDSSIVEAAWFFELAGDEPLFLQETKYMLAGDFNYMDFQLVATSDFPEGFLVAEIWINGAFKKFFRIEVKEL